jgi:ribonuclease HI
MIRDSLSHRPIILIADDVDSYLDRLMAVVMSAINRHVPRAKPSRHAKRWWTVELNTLKSEFTYWRNQARAARRIGLLDQAKERNAQMAKTDYLKAIKRAKRTHWKDFLDNTNNVWKAARYLDPEGASAFARIPMLTDGHNTVDSNESIAYALRHAFFPPLPPVTRSEPIEQPLSPLHCPILTEWEVKRAIFQANPWKAPGIDGLPAAVWQQLWPVIGENIIELFQASLRSGKSPSQWKVARIIPLRKPGKPDYTVPKAYRPISLLATLGKAMEAVIAERLSYWVESEAQLLPKNHFGARKRRSAVQAMMVLQEKIFEAWRNRRVLSLVHFDVKGAYNGVAKEVLIKRLESRRIPHELVRWINDFCSNRQASIVVNGEASAVTDLQQAGLPQGSPLSPILFLFFNADLVQTIINCNQGAIAFVDDYTAWVTGPSAEDNTRLIQDSIIPRATQWEIESGATFETDKTSFIHFTRSAANDSITPLLMKGEQIRPKTKAKILGVIFDQQLRFGLHAARAAKRGLQAALAMKRLKGLQPNSARQIFSATVAPVIDYASSIWLPVVKGKLIKILEPAQRIAAQAITGAFRTASLLVAEAEASIYPLQHRLYFHSLRFWIDLHTLPKSHPFWKLLKSIDTRNTRFKSPLQLLAMMFASVDLSSMETIHPFCLPPWQSGAITFIEEYDIAVQKAQSELDGDRAFFTDGSVRNGLAGIGVAIPIAGRQTSMFLTRSYTLAKENEVNAHFMEIAAVHQAVSMISGLCTPGWLASMAGQRTTSFRVFTDSQSALKVLRNPRRQSGQHLIKEILQHSHDLLGLGGPSITFHWVPGHANVPGNERAHSAARAATEARAQPRQGSKLLKTAAIQLAKQLPLVDYFHKSPTGRFSKELDRALPGHHTRKLYDKRSKGEAAVLAQLRTGKSRLNSSLVKIKAVDTDQCECVERETVQHFLFYCPRWEPMRSEFRRTAGQRWGDTSFVLGGWSGRRLPNGRWLDGELSSWKPDLKTVRAMIDFAMRTGRLDPNTED